MSLRWSVGASHEQGKRSNQEDSIFGEFDGENSVYPLIVLADGMGGHSDGEKASGLVTKAFFEVFRSRKGRTDASSFPGMLREAAREASDILRKAKEGQFPAWWKEKKGPIGSDAGCTLLAAYIDEKTQEVYFLSVGDSLILLQTNGVWQWVNKLCLDTRLNQLLGKSREDRHVVSDVEYEFQRIRSLKDPKAHGLTQAITGRREPNLVGHILGPFPLRAGDRFILASDGLEPFFVGDESLRDDRENFKDLERFLADIPVPRPTSEVVTMCRQSTTTAKNIVQQVLNLHRPNQDNISVVLVEIPSDKAPAVAVSPPRRRHDTEPSPPSAEITVPRDSEAGGISVDAPDSKEVGSSSFWKKASCFLLLLVIAFGGVIWNYRGEKSGEKSSPRTALEQNGCPDTRKEAMLSVLKKINSTPKNIVIDENLKGKLRGLLEGKLEGNTPPENAESLLNDVYQKALSFRQKFSSLMTSIQEPPFNITKDENVARNELPSLTEWEEVEKPSREEIVKFGEEIVALLSYFDCENKGTGLERCESLLSGRTSRLWRELRDSKEKVLKRKEELKDEVLNLLVAENEKNKVSGYKRNLDEFSSSLDDFQRSYCNGDQIRDNHNYKTWVELCEKLRNLEALSNSLEQSASEIGGIFFEKSKVKDLGEDQVNNISLRLFYNLYLDKKEVKEEFEAFKKRISENKKLKGEMMKAQLENLLKQIDGWHKETKKKASCLKCAIVFGKGSQEDAKELMGEEVSSNEKINKLFYSNQKYVVAKILLESKEQEKYEKAFVEALVDWYCSPPDAFKTRGNETEGNETEKAGKYIHIMLVDPSNRDRGGSTDQKNAAEGNAKNAKIAVQKTLEKILTTRREPK